MTKKKKQAIELHQAVEQLWAKMEELGIGIEMLGTSQWPTRVRYNGELWDLRCVDSGNPVADFPPSLEYYLTSVGQSQ